MLKETVWGLGVRMALSDSDLVEVEVLLGVGVFVDDRERDAEQLTLCVHVDVLLGVPAAVLLTLVLPVVVYIVVHVVLGVTELLLVALNDAPVTLGVQRVLRLTDLVPVVEKVRVACPVFVSVAVRLKLRLLLWLMKGDADSVKDGEMVRVREGV